MLGQEANVDDAVHAVVRPVGGGKIRSGHEVRRTGKAVARSRAQKKIGAAVSVDVAHRRHALAEVVRVSARPGQRAFAVADQLPRSRLGGDPSQIDDAVGPAVGGVRRRQVRRRHEIDGAGVLVAPVVCAAEVRWRADDDFVRAVAVRVGNRDRPERHVLPMFANEAVVAEVGDRRRRVPRSVEGPGVERVLHPVAVVVGVCQVADPVAVRVHALGRIVGQRVPGVRDAVVVVVDVGVVRHAVAVRVARRPAHGGGDVRQPPGALHQAHHPQRRGRLHRQPPHPLAVAQPAGQIRPAPLQLRRRQRRRRARRHRQPHHARAGPPPVVGSAHRHLGRRRSRVDDAQQAPRTGRGRAEGRHPVPAPAARRHVVQRRHEPVRVARVGERDDVQVRLEAQPPVARARADAAREAGRFDADIRAYAANVDAAAFDAALQADFVLAIEPMGMYQATHDTAVPAMGADAVRFHTDAPGIFRGTGGGAVPIGVMDTGLNINHLDIASHRSSICGANFIYNDHRTEDADLWIDQNGHGTHVTGTIAGNGSAKQRYAGMAPAVAHIRFAKVLSLHGSGPFDSVSRGMDFLTRASACGNGSLAAKPLVVNMSLAADSRRWEGRTYGERKLDAVVWAHRQLYVVANANADISGFSNYGAAKNSLSVGAAYDNGKLASFSSWGPTFDGRLAPQLVATGADVYSARGQGSRGGYVSNSGTSMASPSVAGVAALLLDAVADYREQPALTRARLMASAIKPDAWLDAGSAFPADNSEGPGVLQAQYGLGKASARTSVLQRKRADGWENGAATSTLTAGSYGHQDIVVPEGASRLDLVLAWDEPPADTIGSTVLNDLDLWLDKDADCTAAACGEHASTSRRDNVEWIIVKNPAAGTYRARVVPQRVYTAAPRAGLAWTIIRDASTPSLRLAVEESRPIAELKYRVVLSVSVDAYVAAGVQVALSGCRAADGMCSPRVQILPVKGEDDGVEHSPLPNRPYTLLGEVGVGERQRVEFDVELDAKDAVRLYFTASAWNADPAVVSVGLDADDDPEAQPPAEVSPPANDHFADAATLDGASGHVDADALTATIEQGEPAALRLGASFVGSNWYRWTAPTRGATRFSTSVGAHVAVFQGGRIAALTPIGANPWNVSFFAEEGQTYRVRVSCLVDTVNLCRPAQMRWSQGPRPVNDDSPPLSNCPMPKARLPATTAAPRWNQESGSAIWPRRCGIAGLRTKMAVGGSEQIRGHPLCLFSLATMWQRCGLFRDTTTMPRYAYRLARNTALPSRRETPSKLGGHLRSHGRNTNKTRARTTSPMPRSSKAQRVPRGLRFVLTTAWNPANPRKPA